MEKIIRSILIVLFILIPFYGFSQDSSWVITEGIGNFFIAVIAGILLAFAFQFLLTNLAVALGITLIGDIRGKGNTKSSSSTDDDDSSSTPTGVKISSGIGIFMLITMSISLFFASLIAVKLSLLANNTIGFTLGLVIWAGYLLLGLYLDAKMVSSLVGSVFSAVKDTLSAGASTVGDMFGTSQKGQMKDTARETVKAIHDEIRQEYDLSDITEKMEGYINKLAPQKMDMDNLHEHLAELLNDIEVKEQYTPDDPEATKRVFLEIAGKQSGFSEKDKEKLKGVFDQAKGMMKKEGSRSDKVMAAVDRLSPGDEEQGKLYREKIEQYLRKTGKQELNPDNLKEDLNRILNNPKAAPEIVKARASMIDRSTLRALLSAREGMTDQKAESYLNKAEELLNQIKSKASEFKNKGQAQVSQRKGQGQQQLDEKKDKVERAIQDWFDRMNQPELEYDSLKRDLQRMMDDPKATPQILKNRLKRMDRDSLIAIISNNKRISREQAEKAADKVEEAREQVIRKAEEIEQKVKEKLNEVKQEGLRQAEAARKTAAAAAWWLFAAAVVSGAASAIGGMLALTY